MKTKMRLIFLMMLTTAFSSLAQQHSTIKKDAVKLIKWKAADCDNRYDPYLLKDRITYLQKRGDTTYITVNFADNCCPEFKPSLVFVDNTLTLFPYEEDLGSCSCNCCFSIEFEILGLSEKTYDIYFNKNKIELSGNHYPVVEPKDTLYKGEKINRTNKYGFKEGLWMTFYKTGEVESIGEYPDVVEYYEADYIWNKGYYISGKRSFNNRKDSTEVWFEDGEVKYERLTYSIGDTTYEKGFNKFDDRKLEERYFKKSFVIVGTESTNQVTEIFYEESYYSNGKPRYVYGEDTTYNWFENGQVKSKEFASGRIAYTEEGFLSERFYEWEEKGPGSWSKIDLNRSLYVGFYKNGNIEHIMFDKEEPNGRYSKNVRYYWEWNKEMVLTQFPKKWKGAYPWKRFPEIKVPVKK